MDEIMGLAYNKKKEIEGREGREEGMRDLLKRIREGGGRLFWNLNKNTFLTTDLKIYSSRIEEGTIVATK
ncbi:unnamed protein product [Meloidogyne enterolobii]|uniref:Uncharacterized protein n=1 Tax=Meloidogyne enterolobii TaxID=390850 RepID=A0ACB0ZY28_MELEN